MPTEEAPAGVQPGVAPGRSDAESWAELTLFYTRTPRSQDDKPEVHARAEVIWGEGRLQQTPSRPHLRSENLGEGLRVLRVSNSYAGIASALARESFDYQLGGGKVDRFTFGFLRRPPVRGIVHPKSGTLGTPAGSLDRFDHFVRVDKLSLLLRVGGSEGPDELARNRVAAILDRLAGVAARDFRGEHVRWLGDVVFGDRPRRVASWSSVPSPEGKSCKGFEVRVQPGILDSIHVQVRVMGLDGMCLGDRMLEWKPGDEAPRRIELQEELASVVVRTWIGGDLAFEEQCARLRGFNGTVQVVGATYSIQDRITEKLENAVRSGAADSRSLERVRRGQSAGMSTRVSAGMASEPWAGVGNVEQTLLDILRPRAEQHAYFPRGAEGRANAVLHFANLISRADRAILVDPWFDEVGAAELLMRVSGDVHLTIVTNLPFPDHVARRRRLQDKLRAIAVTGLPSELNVVCVPCGDSASQAFHDRFLLLCTQSRWRGFVLTNSFSGWATTYPLFVVETPLPTTALLLDELERLLDSTTVTVWPPPRRTATERQAPTNDRGEFPHWRLLLRTLVPNPGVGEAAWLRTAEGLGFVTFTADGKKWRMDSNAREVLLQRLLVGSKLLRFRRPRRARPGLRGSKATRSRRQSLGVGRAVLILGELVARGLDLDARTVAERLHLARALDIERELIRSFRDPPDPALLTANTTRERLMARQSLRPDAGALSAAQFGMSVWNEGLWDIGRRTRWDRCFAYAVLFYLAPARAVSLCERLLDADFLLALVGSLPQRVNDWSDDLVAALIGSGSPMLRALGAQCVAQGSVRARHRPPMTRTVAPLDALADLAGRGVPQNTRALYAAIWGTIGVGPDGAGLDAIAQALRDELPAVEREDLALVVEALFSQEAQALPFLRAAVEELVHDQRDHVGNVLEAIVMQFAQRFRAAGDHESQFSSVVHAELTEVMAQAVAELARRRSLACSDVIRQAADVTRLRGELMPLTPFRHRLHARACDAALGWVILWELVAAAMRHSPTSEPWPAETLDLAREYLTARGHGSSDEARDAMSRFLNAQGIST